MGCFIKFCQGSAVINQWEIHKQLNGFVIRCLVDCVSCWLYRLCSPVPHTPLPHVDNVTPLTQLSEKTWLSCVTSYCWTLELFNSWPSSWSTLGARFKLSTDLCWCEMILFLFSAHRTPRPSVSVSTQKTPLLCLRCFSAYHQTCCFLFLLFLSQLRTNVPAM